MILALVIFIALATILCFMPKIQDYLESFGNIPGARAETKSETFIQELKPYLTSPKSYDEALCKILDSLGDDNLDIQDTTIVPSQNIDSDELDQVVSFVLDSIRDAISGKSLGNVVFMDVTGTVNKSETFGYYEIKGMLHNSTRRVTNKILAEVYVTNSGFKLKRATTTCNNPMTPILSSEKYNALPMDLTDGNEITVDIGYPVQLDPLIDEIYTNIKETSAADNYVQIPGAESTGSLETQSLAEQFENPSSVLKRFRQKRRI